MLMFHFRSRVVRVLWKSRAFYCYSLQGCRDLLDGKPSFSSRDLVFRRRRGVFKVCGQV